MEEYNMEEKVKLSILLDIYKNLLTEKQYEYMDYYCNKDLGLSEIADNKKISRQAVRKMLIQSKEKLEEYENKLNILEKEIKIKQQIKKLEKLNIDKNIIQQIDSQLDF